MKILYILLALLILMILITVHEFGHYIAGKIFKFDINEFSIGFGPAIYKRTKKNGEVFSIRALPLGGYCAFEGEDQEVPNQNEKTAQDEQSKADAKNEPAQVQVQSHKKPFNSQPAWKRLIVLFGGVFFNFMFGIITSAIYLMVAGYGVPVVAASRQGAIQQGDKIVAVNGKTIEAYSPLADILAEYSGETTLTITLVRNGETKTVPVIKEQLENGYFYVANTTKIEKNLYIKSGEEYIEISAKDFQQKIINESVTKDVDGKYFPVMSETYYQKNEDNTFSEYTVQKLIDDGVIAHANTGFSLGIMYYTAIEHYGFFECLLKAWPFGFYICKVILGALGGIFTGATKISDLGGTVTTISTIATYSAINPMIILYLFPMLSFNLAIFNILPIPALDGARMVFVLWELITRKPVNRKVEGYIHTVGLFVLLALVLFLDVYHLFI
ncbi:MAG: RIP metalloprotease RseP [Clostridia bacterium]|nr:RIP metalloprotease RseP [Clostridia bacterium]